MASDIFGGEGILAGRVKSDRMPAARGWGHLDGF